MFDALFEAGSAAFGQVQLQFFEAVVQPLAFTLGAGNLLEEAFAGTGWFLVGVLQILLLLLVFSPLERWRPVEPMRDHAAVRVDVLYTLLHRLGLFRLLLFFSIDPLWDLLLGEMRLVGLGSWQLDDWIAPWWPGVSDTALVGFLVYLVVLDALDYWLHRAQHALPWWWSLHALHHSQRHMTVWSDNRNHLLDDLLRDGILVLVARLIGVAPDQFVVLVVCGQMVESLSHANLKMWFGPVFERVLVSPRYHRLHHGIGLGHESQGPGSLGGHNFAVLLPIWDVLFRTANFERRYDPTGIRDQLPAQGGRDYGRGFWRQQWLGLVRLAATARLSSRP